MHERVPLSSFDLKTSFSPMIKLGFFIEHDEVPFEYRAKKFSFINAYWLADFSRLAYVRGQKLVRKELKAAGFTKVKFIENKKTGTQAFIAHNTKAMVLVFRGTELGKDNKDILIDVDFFLTKAHTKGKVHHGFQKALDSVWDEIKAYLDKNHKKQSIWFTGHSLGASLATIASSRYKVNGTYTFGSPRLGTKKFLKTIKSPVYRITKNRDIVVRTPPPIFYRHIGDTYFIGEEGEVTKNPSMLFRFKERLGGSEIKIIWLLIKLIFLGSPWDLILNYLHDHSPYNYSVYMWNNIDD